MTTPVRVHVGNGSVYLRGWVNMDLYESGAALATNEPERVERLGTTEDDYYAKSRFVPGKPPLNPADFVCDAYGSWESMPFETESVDEILSRQCFEHLSKREANWAFMEAFRVLKAGGTLRIDIPDHDETIKQFADRRNAEANGYVPPTEKESAAFMLRHLLGSRKNDFAYHMGSWTRDRLIAFAEERGFLFDSEEKNIHFYPAFCLRFQKGQLEPGVGAYTLAPWLAPWQYAGNPRGTPISVPADWQCLEVGPGDAKCAWPRANVYADHNAAVLEEIIPQQGQPHKSRQKVCCDIDMLADHFKEKEFDFVLTSHILEHVEHPEHTAEVLSQIAKSGCIVVPSPGKEALFWNHESDHKWLIHLSGDTLHFFPKQQCPELADVGASSIMHKLLRLGAPQYGQEGAYMRRQFRQAEPYLDNILYWEGSPKIQVHR